MMGLGLLPNRPPLTSTPLLDEEHTPVLTPSGEYSLPGDALFAGSVYGESKFDAELGVRAVLHQLNSKSREEEEEGTINLPEAVFLYPGSLMGPLSPDPFAMSGWARAFLRSFSAPMAPPGSICIGDVRDVASAFVRAANKPPGALIHDRFHVTGEFISLLDMIAEIRRPFGDAPSRVAPDFALCAAGLLSEAYSRISRAVTGTLPKGSFDAQTMWLLTQHLPLSCERAKNELGFRPRPLAEMIDETRNWLKEEGYDV
jgi:nucleoside-diphosphate-sugar epimerase